MESFILYPVLGLRTNFGNYSQGLLKPIENGFASYCVDGRNISLDRVRMATSKSQGRSEWSNSAVGTPSYCLGIFELYDGSNRVIWMVYDGDVYRYDGSRDPQEVADAGSTAFASDQTDFYSLIRYGDYMVFSDYGEHTPYCSDHNDANLVKLVSADTEYKGKYLASFQRRIFLAHITSGITTAPELSIVWTDANPVPGTSCTFGAGDPPTNHLYLPTDDEITGIKRMGNNACFVYSDSSINRLDYYADYTNPFGMTTIHENEGFVNHHGIVSARGMHFGFNKNYGFCAFDGSRNFPAGGNPVSQDIENWVRDIKSSSYPHIIGSHYPFRNKILWTVALEGSDTPNAILSYDYLENAWTRTDLVAHYISPIVVATDVTWTKLITELGYTDWTSTGTLRWSDFIDETPYFAMSATDGKLYYYGTEGDDGSAWDGYRVEPVLDFGSKNDKDLLLEIWFGLVETGDYSIYVHHRSGNTVGECTGNTWTVMDEVSCDDPANAVCRLSKLGRYHQIKWGTDAADEPFVTNQIEFKYVRQGRY